MGKVDRCKCPWCGKWILSLHTHCKKYRHCGRGWEIDKRGMIYNPVDLRATPGYDPKKDSWEIEIEENRVIDLNDEKNKKRIEEYKEELDRKGY